MTTTKEEYARMLRDGASEAEVVALMTADGWHPQGARAWINRCKPGAPVAHGATGAEADIEANYPGGLVAFRHDEPVDRTPRHKTDCE